MSAIESSSAVPAPAGAHSVGRGDRGEVSVDLDAGEVGAKTADPLSGYQLAVVQLCSGEIRNHYILQVATSLIVLTYPLKVVTTDQMVKAAVGDERTIVQLEDGEGLAGAGGAAQCPGALVCDELAMRERERLQTGAVRRQLCNTHNGHISKRFGLISLCLVEFGLLEFVLFCQSLVFSSLGM